MTTAIISTDATQHDHDECYRRYYRGCNGLAEYGFSVADDLSAVSLTHSAEWTNGIWALAEVRAAGHSWREVAAVAAKMRAAVRAARRTLGKDGAK